MEDKTYDGNQDASVTGVEFTGLVEGDSLTSGTDYTAKAAFTDKNAGDSKQATVTVTLKGAATIPLQGTRTRPPTTPPPGRSAPCP